MGCHIAIGLLAAGLAASGTRGDEGAMDIQCAVIRPAAGVTLPEQTLTPLPRGKSFEVRVLRSLDIEGESFADAEAEIDVLSWPSLRCKEGEAATLAVGEQVPYEAGARVGETAVQVTRFADVGLQVSVTWTVVERTGEMNVNVRLDASEREEMKRANSPVVVRRAVTEVNGRVEKSADLLISTRDGHGAPILLALDIEEAAGSKSE